MKKLLALLMVITSLSVTAQIRARIEITEVNYVDDSTWSVLGMITDFTGSYSGLSVQVNDKIIQRGVDSVSQTVFDRFKIVEVTSADVNWVTVKVRSDFHDGVLNNAGSPVTGAFPIGNPVSDSKVTYKPSYYQQLIDPDYDAGIDNLNLYELFAGQSSTNLWTKVGDNIYNTNTGNVGINTTAPQARLTIQSDATTEIATLGADILAGTFTAGTGWVESPTGTFTHTAGTANTITCSATITNNTLYQVDYIITRTAGTLTWDCGNWFQGGLIANGGFCFRSQSTLGMVITPTSSFVGSISITLKPVASPFTATLSINDNAGNTNMEVRSSLSTKNNLLIGKNAGSYLTSGYDNTCLGTNAGYMLGSGFQNTYLGYNVGYNFLNGYENVGIGASSLYSLTSSARNVAIGNQAGYSLTVGSSNAFIGWQAGYSVTQTSGNVFIGYLAGRYYGTGTSALTSSTESILIGYNAHPAGNTTTNEIVIGNAIGKGANTARFGTNATVDTYLYGAMHFDSIPNDPSPDSVITTKNGVAYRAPYTSGVTPDDYTFDWDGTKYLPYTAKKGVNPSYPYFFTGYNYPTYNNNLKLDGSLTSIGYTSINWNGNDIKTSTLNSSGFTDQYAKYQDSTWNTALFCEDGFGRLNSYSNTARSIPIVIGSTIAYGVICYGQHIKVDDYGKQFLINMDKIKARRMPVIAGYADSCLYFDRTDSTFKQRGLGTGGGTVTSVSATTPLQSSGGNTPTISVIPDSLTQWYTKMNKGSVAYGWGNHASAGYLTSQISHADVVVDGDFTSEGIMLRGASSGVYSILTNNSTNWNTAYGWGNHAGLYPPNARTISTTTPLSGGGDLSGNRTFAIIPDSLTDWRTKMNKGVVAYNWGNHSAKQDSVKNPWYYLGGKTIQRAFMNVGIGTTNPINWFEVQGDKSATDLLFVRNNRIVGGVDSSVIIDNRGWVGIGMKTTHPLSVWGDANINGSLIAPNIYSTMNLTNGTNNSNNFGASLVSGNYCFANQQRAIAMGYYAEANGTISFAMGDHVTAETDYSWALGTNIKSNGLGSMGIGLNPFRLTPDSISKDSVFCIMGGDVGIGTVKPSVKFEVDGTAKFTGLQVGAYNVSVTSSCSIPQSLTDYVQKGDTGIVAGNFATPHDLTTGLAGKQASGSYRTMTDHDSLNTLQEKSYNSLDDKPTLNLSQWNNARSVSDHDSLSQLQEKSYNSLDDKPTIPAPSQWTTNGSDIYYSTGNVGVGITAPIYDIDASLTGTIRGGSILVGSTYGLTKTSAHLELGKDGAITSTGIYTDNTSRIHIETGGNVGIGTTDPSQSLHIVKEGSAALFNDSYSTTTTTTSAIHLRKSHSATVANVATIDGESLGSFVAKGNTGSGFGNASAIYTVQQGTAGATYIPASLRFATSDGTNIQTDRMTITPTGNVGIGTTEPIYGISVKGLGVAGNIQSVSTTAGSSSVIGAFSWYLPSAADHRLAYFGGGSKNEYEPTNLYGAVIRMYSEAAWTATVSHPSYLTISTTPSGSATLSERMRVTGSGNIGIGTTAPAYKLEVAGGKTYLADTSIVFKEFMTSAGGGKEFITNANVGLKNRTYGYSATYTSIRMNGTYSSPTKVLSGNGIINLAGRGYDGVAESNSRVAIQAFAPADWSATSHPTYLSFSTTQISAIAQTERMRIKDDGFVGIGTTAPTAKLSVSGGNIQVSQSGADSVSISSGKGVRYYGNATVWDDLMFPFTEAQRIGATCPAYVTDSGYYNFTVDTVAVGGVCKMYMMVQLPHKWREGSNLHPHVHYKHSSTNGTPTFICRYRWFNLGSVPGGFTWIKMNTTTGTTNNTHQLVENASATISGSGKTLSSLLQCEIYLESQTGTGGANAYQFDIHYEIDSDGSDAETTKAL